MNKRQRADLLMKFDRWGFDQKGWASTTRYRYGRRTIQADDWLTLHRDISVAWATSKDLQTYLFQSHPTPQNRNDIRQSLVAFGTFLIALEWREDNAALGLPRLPVPSSIPKALDVEVARRIVKVAATFDPMYYAMVMVILYGGLRRDEARCLEWRQVGESAEWLSITGKGRKDRQVPLHEDAQVALMSWRLRCAHPHWVFPSTRFQDRPLSTTQMAMIVREVGDAAGISHLHPHALRHTVATRMLEVGGDLRAVQEFLGHARPETTAIYTKVRPARIKANTDLLDFDESASESDIQ